MLNTETYVQVGIRDGVEYFAHFQDSPARIPNPDKNAAINQNFNINITKNLPITDAVIIELTNKPFAVFIGVSIPQAEISKIFHEMVKERPMLLKLIIYNYDTNEYTKHAVPNDGVVYAALRQVSVMATTYRVDVLS